MMSSMHHHYIITLKLAKTVHGYFGRSSDKLQQPGLHFVVKVLHRLPEPNDDIIIGSVAVSVDGVLTPVVNADLSKTTEQVLDGRGREGEGERGREGGREGGRERGECTQLRLNIEYILPPFLFRQILATFSD